MLGETEVKDDVGNIIISPGLKVRHKSSQYEYTVDNVVQDPQGQTQIILRMPDEPRFAPPSQGKEVMQDVTDREGMLYEIDPDGLYIADEPGSEFESEHEYLSDDELLAVPQSEFERDYEVK